MLTIHHYPHPPHSHNLDLRMPENTLHEMGLIGRDDDFKRLVQAYENTKQTGGGERQPPPPQELVLIRGRSGAGKTTLARSLKEHVVEQDSGFFLVGKFELTTLQHPYAVFVSAFDHFTEELFRESHPTARTQTDETRIVDIRHVIQEAVGNEGKLLTDMIPSLERLMGKQENACDVRAADALNRFHFVFCKFCRAIATVAPLVIIFDDLQWSDAASLELIHALIQSRDVVDKDRSSLLIIAAYRDEIITVGSERSLNSAADQPHLPLCRYLQKFDDFSKTGCLRQTKISLHNLDEQSTITLVERFLDSSDDSTSDLAQIIHKSSLGNPFHAKQLLQLLVNQDHLYRDAELDNMWLWDVKNILEVVGSANTIDEMVRRKITALPLLAQQVLQIAACIGDKVDFLAISTVLDQAAISDIELSLQAAAQDGYLIFDRRLGLFRFVHDRIRQVVLSSIDNKEVLYFDIGYKLWKCIPPPFLSAKLFVVTNLLNHGISRLTDQSERYKVATLNLEAGVQSASLVAFPDASKYLNAGIELLDGGDYWEEEYELALSLFSVAADVEVCNQNFDRVGELVGTVLEHARTAKDSLVAYCAKINSLGQKGLVAEATLVGFEALQQLGHRIPQKATQMATNIEIIKAKISLRFRSDANLLSAPSLEDENKVAVIQILTTLWPYFYRSGSKHVQLMAARLLRLCLKHMRKVSPLGIAAYSTVLCVNESCEGYRLMGLALSQVEKYKARELIPVVHLNFYAFIYHWKHPLKESVVFLQNAETVGMEIGDVEHAMLSLSFKCFHNFCCGMALDKLEGCLIEATKQMHQSRQHSILHRTNALLQYVHNLRGRVQDPQILAGEIVSLHDTAVKVDDMTIPYVRHFYGADLAFMFGEYELAQKCLEQRKNLDFAPYSSYMYVMDRFKEGLICVALARLDVDAKRNINTAKAVLKQMTRWARNCRENFFHKQCLIEAEIKSLQKCQVVNHRTLALYEQSIEGALPENFVQEAALACELCGKYLNRQGESIRGATFLEKARNLYLNWGATEKASRLVET